MLELIRIEKGQNETVGVLTIDNKVLCYTLELPYLDNKNNISCIPEGEYKMIKTDNTKFGICWQITDVPNRLGILIHNGNTHKDIQGCILLGQGVGYLDEIRAVLNSRNAIFELMTLTKDLMTERIKIRGII